MIVSFDSLFNSISPLLSIYRYNENSYWNNKSSSQSWSVFIRRIIKQSLRCVSGFTASALIFALDRNNIFPPLLNDPERILSNKSRRERKRTPNAFFVCRMNVQNEVARKNLNVNMRIISKAAEFFFNYRFYNFPVAPS